MKMIDRFLSWFRSGRLGQIEGDVFLSFFIFETIYHSCLVHDYNLIHLSIFFIRKLNWTYNLPIQSGLGCRNNIPWAYKIRVNSGNVEHAVYELSLIHR